MNDLREIPLPHVERIRTESGYSYIEPPLREEWTREEKLAWHAAVVAAETGLRIDLFKGETRVAGLPGHGYYNVLVGASSAAPFSFDGAWTYLNGVSCGVEQDRRADQ